MLRNTFNGRIHFKRILIACLLIFISASGIFAEEQDDLRADRPNNGNGPTEVEFFVFVLDIDDIDGAEQNFTANVYMRMKWKDERLAREGVAVRILPIEEIWNPHLIVANQQGIVRTSLPEVVRVRCDGTVSYAQRYLGALSQPLSLREFPFDHHKFLVNFVSTRYAPDELKFVAAPSRRDPNIIGGSMYEEVSVADWEIVGFKAEARAYEPVPGIETAAFVFEFTADRYSSYYVWQVIIPLMLIVMMSWGALWIDPKNSGTQIGLATTSILTLIAYRFMLGTLVPRLPYMTKLDFFTFGSTVLVFCMLVEVLATSYLARMGHEKMAHRMDRVGRVIFPLVFLIWSVWAFLR